MGITQAPWKAVRSQTCGHLRAEHNYSNDPKAEWTDADIAAINAVPNMIEAIKTALDVVHGPNMPSGVAKNQLLALLSGIVPS